MGFRLSGKGPISEIGNRFFMKTPKLFIHLSLMLALISLAGCGRGPRPGPPPIPPSETAAPISGQAFRPAVRDGFAVRKWADIPNARSLAVSPDGKFVFVGSRQGSVTKVTVTDEGPVVERFQEGLNGSNGVCFFGDDLVVAELLRVRRFAAKDGFPPGAEGEVILDGLPAEKQHGWRYIRTGPDGRIRMSIGAPCNVCERKDDPRFATICSFTAEGRDFRIDAKGVRNSVGFDWHPESKELYFTDNGRDQMGDDIPPCELNLLSAGEEGSHYGFPYFWGDNQPDPQFGKLAPALEFVKPLVKFQAHVAPLGCYFPKGESLKASLKDQVVVAQHGSWNRSSPVGYQVVTVNLAEPAKAPEPLLWGFLDEKDQNRKFGRPVDIAELPDGTLLVSDDYGGVIWAVTLKS
jgi:glucose/arabinose dehydrogenase